MQLLSLLLETKIRIKQILPNDSVRLADEYTLLITDIVIETEDGRIANLEIQKIGYVFPGQRTACYSADLLLRQYKRVKDRKRRESKKFNYRDLKKVYTIVLFEKSTREFHEIPDKYLHYGEHTYDTGLKLETLQKSVLVALDIFQKNIENRSIENKLEAWLLLLSSDEPERIMELLEMYPEFREIYEEVYQMCRNVEGIMSLFSKELEEMDRNTVSYMIEELEAEVKAAEERAEQERQEREAAEERAKQEMEEQKREIAELQEKIRRLESAKKEELE
nr:PD-(D/E)XK nuclease family transposase [uncultured Blautia sp.]